jgi:peroxiredoxin
MEFPYIEELYRRYREKGLVVLAVESRGDHTGARELMEDKHYSFPVLFDTKGVHNNEYKVYSFPTSLLLDTDGNIVFRHVGFYPGMEQVLDDEIRELLHLAPIARLPSG